MSAKIPLSTPTLNGTELSFIQEALDTNWVAPLGPHVDAFEAEMAAYVGIPHAAALSSGTAAIHLALKAAGVGQGDIVFCSDLTFAASCNPIMYEKAQPVFIDNEYESWNMCPAALEAAFAKYPNAKAVIAVNLYGTPAKLDEIAEICRTRNIPLIEDAAESLGATLHGRQTASFGDIGILSFNGNKIITTSGGGMLLSNNEDIVKKARFWATQSRDPAPHYQHSELGYNYRLSNICAAIGRGQLATLDERIAQKTAIYNTYSDAFKNHPWIALNPIPAACASNHWLSCITLEKDSPITPINILEKLAQNNIEARPIWKPMSLQPYYQSYDAITTKPTPAAHDIYTRGLCLPSDVKMKKTQQEQICSLILDDAMKSAPPPLTKRIFDILISFIAGIFLIIPALIIAVAIKLDSKGSVIFSQNRIGLGKKTFNIYKFRTMRIDAPTNIPTHMLASPENFITKVGRFLRKSSLDEIPQIINILKGDMSIVGPRPALYNQTDLITLRDKYGANDIRPGLTGLAQIMGRDELPIGKKAALDGEYAKNQSFLYDLRIIFQTFLQVIRGRGIKEGLDKE